VGQPVRAAGLRSAKALRHRHLVAAVLLCVLLAGGCATRSVRLPIDPGTPFPDAATVHAERSAACGRVTSFTAELGLAGRAGRQRLRGRVIAGFAAPDSMRLEGVAPFGAPAFILAARDGRATLLLPREDSVLQDARPEEILGALTGVALAPGDLMAILTGCVVPQPKAQGGRLHAGGWASIALDGGATVYLKRAGEAWQVRAARRTGWQIEYQDWAGDFPRAVRLRSDSGAVAGAPVDLTATVSELEANVPLSPDAFTVIVPPTAVAITLDDLRDAGPLR